MIKTAEKERISKETRISDSSEANKEKKLARLKILKEKLAEIEKKEEDTKSILSTQTPNIDENGETTTSDTASDKYYTQLDTELMDLEVKIAEDISSENIDKIIKSEKIIAEEFEKTKILAKSDHETSLTKKDLKEVDTELEKLEAEIDLEQKKAAVIVSIFDKLSEEHEWVKEPQYGFMYSMPDKKKNKKDYESWIDDWSKVLFDYARIASNHIIYSKTLLSEKPWSDFKDRATSIQEITNNLVKQQIAEWLGKKKEKLRIYWLSLEEWADKIVIWAIEIAFTEPIFVTDIKEAEQDFSSLPDDDIIKTFNIIAKQGKGTKIKLENDLIAIRIKFD